MNDYTDYETAFAASTLDIGVVIGGVIIGYLTDLTYSRRIPITVLCIFIASGLQLLMIVISPETRVLFFVYIFFLGMLMGGAIAIISGISCADLVRSPLFVIRIYRANSSTLTATKNLWEQLWASSMELGLWARHSARSW
jgi:sugar phosphate permease